MKRSSIVWLGVALVTFAAAVALTAVVTGSGEERTEAAAGEPWPTQILAIRVGGEGPLPEGPAEVTVAPGTVSIALPPGRPVKVLLNNLDPGTPCTIVKRDPSLGLPLETAEGIAIAPVGDFGQAFTALAGSLGVVSVPPQEGADVSLDCTVQTEPTELTFTKRAAELWNTWDFSQVLPAVMLPEALQPEAGFSTLPGGYLVEFAIDDADAMTFYGGTARADTAGRETRRIVPPDAAVRVQWDSLFREGRRDIILIIIGTLIGIGVTVLIEGIRPYIERL